MPNMVSAAHLAQISAMVIELTRIRQSEIKHLVVENFAPELFGSLLREFYDVTEGKPQLRAVQQKSKKET